MSNTPSVVGGYTWSVYINFAALFRNPRMLNGPLSVFVLLLELSNLLICYQTAMLGTR